MLGDPVPLQGHVHSPRCNLKMVRSCVLLLLLVADWATAITIRNPDGGRATAFSMLMQLDGGSCPGLPADCFVSLFYQCRHCKWVTTRRAFDLHECLTTNPRDNAPVIDLTLDDSDIEEYDMDDYGMDVNE